MKTKKSIFFAFLIIILICFSGCSEQSQLNQKLIVQGIGVDFDENKYDITVQALDFKNPVDEDEPSIKILEIKGDSLFDALENISKQTSLTPVYSQNMIIILGENVANSGVNNFMDFFVRHCETRPKVKICVAQNKASEYLKIKSGNKTLKAKDIHDLIPNNLNSDVLHFISNLKSSVGDSYLAWLDIQEKNQIKNVHFKGVAVFSDDEIKGLIDGEELLAVMILKGASECGACLINNEKIGKLTCSVDNSKIKTNVMIENGIPNFNIDLDLKISVFSMDGEFNFAFDDNTKNDIGFEFSKKVTTLCKAVIQKLISLNIDIFDFGKILKNSYPNYFKKINNNWKGILGLCNYNVNANTGVIITGKEPV